MLHNRRRNRLNCVVVGTDGGQLTCRVQQSFGNCPQYIVERDLSVVGPPIDQQQQASAQSTRSEALTAELRALIERADTLFLASGWDGPAGAHSDGSDARFGMDASHRGGARGFVLARERSIEFLDYKGNNLFNTVGNLVQDPRVGVLFVDFQSGSWLHLTGRATVLFGDGIDRKITIDIDQFVFRPSALPLRWKLAINERPLILVKRERQTRDVVSLYFVSAHEYRPLDSFVAGQYLPLRVNDHERTYSLSGPPQVARGHGDSWYRITVKNVGRVSSQLHQLPLGSVVTATGRPQGEFVAEVPYGVVGADVVLIGGGVGVTPLVAMAHSFADDPRASRVLFISSAATFEDSVLRHDLVELATDKPERVQVHFRLSKAAIDDVQCMPTAPAIAFSRGRLDATSLRDILADRLAPERHIAFFVCGPTGFMTAVAGALREIGVAEDKVHSEKFGPSAL